MDKKIPTIKEIATRLNVSVSTVSRALHNHHSIGLRTKMRVQALAKELNYEPNQTAIFFKQKRTFIIGVIVPELKEEFFSYAINGIEDVAGHHKYSVLIGQSHDDMGREKEIVAAMKRNRVDGILVSTAKSTTEFSHFQEMEAYGVPVVFFDREPAWPEACSVQATIEKATQEAIAHLIENGHTRIAHLQGPSHFLSVTERNEGYAKVLKEHKIKEDKSLMVHTDLTRAGTQQAMIELLKLKNPPTAVVCFNDYVMFDAVQYAKKNYTAAAPLQFVSYANLPVSDYFDYSHTISIEQYPYQQGEKATELLLQRINHPSSVEKGSRIYIEGSVVYRQ